MLSGCGLAKDSASQNLSVWHQLSGSGNKAMQGVVDGFNKEHPDQKFQNRQLADGEADTVVRTGISGKNPPAILQFEGFKQTEDYAKAGLLTDITGWWNTHKDSFSYADSKSVAGLCSYKGKVYCIPLDLYTSNVLYVNPNVLKKYDIKAPTQVSDFVAIAKKLKGTGINPVALYSGEGWEAAQWWYLLTIQRCGIDKINAAAAQVGAKWDDPCFLKAAQDLGSLADGKVFPQGVAGSDYNSMMSLFLSGKAAFMQTGTWFEQTLAETPPSFDVQAVPFPQVDSSSPSVEQLGGINEGFGIPSAVKDTKASYAFLDYMAQKSTGVLFSKASAMNMVAGSETDLPERLQPAWKQVSAAFKSDGQGFVTYFEGIVDPAVGDQAMYNGATGVAAGTITPPDFVKSVQKAAVKAAG
jgi:ABC-type glycerol-3-phosphate transport system substrate-binding protein